MHSRERVNIRNKDSSAPSDGYHPLYANGLDDSLHLLGVLLLGELDKLLVQLGIAALVLVIAVGLGRLVAGCLLGNAALGLDHDNRRRALRPCSLAELAARGNKNVGGIDILARQGQVHDDLGRVHIAGNNDNAGNVGGGRSRRVLGGGFAEGLVDLLDTAQQSLLLGS